MLEENRDRNICVADAIERAAKLYECGDAAAAINYASSFLEQYPDSAALHGYMAAALSLAGRLEEALVHAERAVHLAPKSEKWSVVLTRTLWKADRRDDAFEEIKRYLAISPSEIYSRMLRQWEVAESNLGGTNLPEHDP